MFESFERARAQTREAEINPVRGGEGPPVLLLHDYPQTHAMWHRVAPLLAESFTVAADLRGYGDSSKPPGNERHTSYSKRAMAGDQVEAMALLGFGSFAVVGHDRGARVGHRMALDHADRVTKLAVRYVVPAAYTRSRNFIRPLHILQSRPVVSWVPMGLKGDYSSAPSGISGTDF